MTRALTGFLVGAPVWLAIGVYIGLRLVWAEEPAATPTVRDYGFWREFERVDSV